MTARIDARHLWTRSMPAANSGFKKLAVQWLNEVLCFYSSSVLADTSVLRNPPDRKTDTLILPAHLENF